jgi:hypothetical protein
MDNADRLQAERVAMYDAITRSNAADAAGDEEASEAAMQDAMRHYRRCKGLFAELRAQGEAHTVEPTRTEFMATIDQLANDPNGWFRTAEDVLLAWGQQRDQT